jgi:acyl carrier protein
MPVRNAILNEIANVAEAQKKTLTPFDDSSPLLGIGLDSLCFAILLARLEETFDVDPFDAPPDGDALPVTVGDFVAIYERVLA